jgi:D-3-phosphoglycerate dehydrogenase
MPRVAVTDFGFDDLDVERSILEPLGCTLASLKTGKKRAELLELVRDADYVITQFAPVDAGVIDAMPRCRLIVRYGIGVDNVDLAAAAARGIPVCNVPDYCTDEVADHTLAMILEMTRRVSQTSAVVKSGRWAPGVPPDRMRALKDMTVGVVAFGRIGRAVALRLKPFKCRILVHDPAVPPARIEEDGFAAASLGDLLARSDLVTLHCPSSEQTRHLINARSIATMKRGALLVNVSRGTLVRTDDLVAALQDGHLSAAGLDVVDPEPIAAGHPLLGMDQVLITPHCASVSTASVRKLRTSVAETVAIAVRGGPLPNIVNGVKA